MSLKNNILFIFIVWFVIIAGFIGYKEYTLTQGQKILLKTVPQDPRDIFRGDYVVLNYEISRLNGDSIKHDFVLNISENKYFYLVLQKAEKYWAAVEIRATAPVPVEKSNAEQIVFIRGKIISQHGNTITAEYGIENYFIEEGKGKELEQAAQKSQLEVEVSVDKFGNAVINKVHVTDKVDGNGNDNQK